MPNHVQVKCITISHIVVQTKPLCAIVIVTRCIGVLRYKLLQLFNKINMHSILFFYVVMNVPNVPVTYHVQLLVKSTPPTKHLVVRKHTVALFADT